MKDVLTDDFSGTGSKPEVSQNLEPQNRAIETVSQGISVHEAMWDDSKSRIKNAARITAKINGEKPYDGKKLERNKEGHKTNISTGFLGTECSKVPARFFMPIKQARYLTAAALPKGHNKGPEKTEVFREAVTETIRSWPRWNTFLRGLYREVGYFGYGFASFFDSLEWRPSFVRMDRGFIPSGTEQMDEPAFFSVRWQYKPHELLDLARKSIEAGMTVWKKEAVATAVTEATTTTKTAIDREYREFEELVRQSNSGNSYTRGSKVVEAVHLFAKEYTGKVSHYIYYPNASGNKTDDDNDPRLLMKWEDRYDSMLDAVIPFTFDFGDGTIHGSWGAGQILYDMSVQVEKIRNDEVDLMRATGKTKIQIAEGQDPKKAKLMTYGQYMVVSGGTFAGAQAALPSTVDGHITLDEKLTQLGQQKIGAYLPPIPSQPSDIKAAQVNAAIQQEKEVQEDKLDQALSQLAMLITAITKRLCNPSTNDPEAIALQNRLLASDLTPEEIGILVNQPAIKTVTEFTPLFLQQKAAFAASKAGNQLYNQRNLEQTQAEAAGGTRFAEYVMLPEDDQTVTTLAIQKQMSENAALFLGQQVPVAVSDNHWVHMQTMKPQIEQVIQMRNVEIARAGLMHYAGHYDAGVQTKTIPKEAINQEKSYIAQVDKAISDIEGAIARQTEIEKNRLVAEEVTQTTGIPAEIGEQAVSMQAGQMQQPMATEPNLQV